MKRAARRSAGSDLPEGIERTALTRDFYERPTLDVARDLLGKYFVRTLNNTVLGGYIVEVEAYHQNGDEAAHTYRGQTERNAVMFGPGGFLYVYFTYGMHFCMNVVTETEGTGAAVLIRAIEPVQGLDVMRQNRGNPVRPRDITNGPAKCCQAMAIQRTLNGAELGHSEVAIYNAPSVPSPQVLRTERIGIKKSTELDWRFIVNKNAFLSRNPGNERLIKQYM